MDPATKTKIIGYAYALLATVTVVTGLTAAQALEGAYPLFHLVLGTYLAYFILGIPILAI